MILEEIVADKKRRLPEHMARISESQMRRMAEETKTREANCFYNHLKKPGLSIIGEFKKASPSLGTITSKIDLTERIAEYNASVDAISCLTEEDHFHGNVEYLKEIRAKSQLPILRKDFIVDEYQLYQAKIIGADAVLLIAAALKKEELHALAAKAHELGLEVLLEIHSAEELKYINANMDVIGINNRNLGTFFTDVENSFRLAEQLPLDAVLVSESGISDPATVKRLQKAGFKGFLIGENFMKTDNPELALKSFIEVLSTN